MKKIAILYGGISTERAVALKSGINMRDWCEKAGYEVTMYDVPEMIDTFLDQYQSYDLIVPVLHGRYGEDGIITGMCETLGLRVAGSSSWVHAICIDKFHTNCVVEKLGIKVPKSWLPGLPKPAKLIPESTTWEKDEVLEIKLIVKPNQWGSSLGATQAKSLREFRDALSWVNEIIASLTSEKLKFLEWNRGKWFVRHFPSLTDLPIVQECIDGREFTIWIYSDENGYHALPIIEIITLKQDFFDYEEKYETDGSNEVFLEWEEHLQSLLREQSITICQFIGTRGVVRLDWRYDGTDLYFLEVNTIPGFTSGSLVPKMWKKAGKSEGEFVEILDQ
jgi:D-alanine-D-alanine ligase